MRYAIVETNPNEAIGGGGCLCSPSKCEDCKGPFIIFPATETDSNLSPHAVLSVHCAAAALAKAVDEPDAILAAGEKE